MLGQVYFIWTIKINLLIFSEGPLNLTNVSHQLPHEPWTTFRVDKNSLSILNQLLLRPYFQSGWERARSQLGTRYMGNHYEARSLLVSSLTKNTSSGKLQFSRDDLSQLTTSRLVLPKIKETELNKISELFLRQSSKTASKM